MTRAVKEHLCANLLRDLHVYIFVFLTSQSAQRVVKIMYFTFSLVPCAPLLANYDDVRECGCDHEFKPSQNKIDMPDNNTMYYVCMYNMYLALSVSCQLHHCVHDSFITPLEMDVCHWLIWCSDKTTISFTTYCKLYSLSVKRCKTFLTYKDVLLLAISIQC